MNTHKEETQDLEDLINRELPKFRTFEENLRVDTHATSIWSKAIRTIDEQSFTEIAEKLSQLPQLVKIGRRTMHHGMVGAELKDETIAEWLIWRSLRTSAHQALQDLIKFLGSKQYTGLQISVLGGVRVPSPFQISDDMTLIPYDELEQDIMKFQFERRMKDMLLFSPEIRPGAAIVSKHPHPTILSGIESSLRNQLSLYRFWL